MKIAICGGTFDPFHRGHLEPVLEASAILEWDRVIYVPAHRQPFKLDRESASGYHRFAMASLALEEHDALYLSDWELERDTTSFTVDTLEHLRTQHAGDTIDWVIGDDNLPQLNEWKSLDRIFELANFAVLTRSRAVTPDEALAARVTTPGERGTHGAIVFARNATVPVSSTEIRERVRRGAPIDTFVDPRVAHYIHHYGLYKGNA